MVKSPHAMPENWIRSLGQEDPLEKGIATHSSILALRIPRTEEPGGLQSKGSQRVGHNCSDLAAATAHKLKMRNKHKINTLSFTVQCLGKCSSADGSWHPGVGIK